MSSVIPNFGNECRIRMKWKLKEDYLKDALKNLGEGLIQSEIYNASNIPGVKYSLFLKMYDDELVGIYFYLIFNMVKEIHASYTLSVKSAQYEVKEEEIYPKTTSWGSELCSIEELFLPQYKFFVNGIIVIELEATLKARGIKRKAVELCTLANVLWESDDKDLTVIAEEQELKVHKWVISSKSPVFKAELNSGMKEAIENTINITDFSYECVKIAMEFCYERNITQLVNERNASELLHFADKYDIKVMHSELQTLLIKKLSALNVCHFANISLTTNADELKEYCVCFLMYATKKEIVVKNSKKLDEEILKEIGRRSLFSLSE